MPDCPRLTKTFYLHWSSAGSSENLFPCTSIISCVLYQILVGSIFFQGVCLCTVMPHVLLARLAVNEPYECLETKTAPENALFSKACKSRKSLFTIKIPENIL